MSLIEAKTDEQEEVEAVGSGLRQVLVSHRMQARTGSAGDCRCHPLL